MPKVTQQQQQSWKKSSNPVYPQGGWASFTRFHRMEGEYVVNTMLGIPVIYISVHYPFLSYFSLNSGKESKIQPIPRKTKSRLEGRCPSLTPKAVITNYPFDREKDRHKDKENNPGTQVQGPPHTFPLARKAVASGGWGGTHRPAGGAGGGGRGPAWPLAAPSGPRRGLWPRTSFCATGKAPNTLSSP